MGVAFIPDPSTTQLEHFIVGYNEEFRLNRRDAKYTMQCFLFSVKDELYCVLCDLLSGPHSHVSIREDLYSMGWEPGRYLSSPLEADFD